MKKVFKSYLLVFLTCLIFALTFSVSVSAKKVSLSKPKITVVKKISDTAIRIKWKKVKKAKKYEVYSSVNGKKFKKVGTTSKTSFDNIVSIQGGNTYTYKVKAVKGKTKSKFSTKIKISIPKSYSSDPKTNFNNLVKLINTHSTKDSSGNHYVQATIVTGGAKNIFIITVKGNKLHFYSSTESDSAKLVSTMVYGIEEITKDSAVVETSLTSTKGVKVKGHANLKPSTYTASTTLNYIIDSSNTSSSPQSLLNSHAVIMFSGCNGNLKSFIGSMTLKSIGFKSFK